MKDIKSSRLPGNIRGGIIIIAIIYIITSPFARGSPWDERFMPNLINVSASVCALYTWGSVISLKQLFKARRQFEIITEMYQGEQLQEKLFEDSSLLYYTDENINKAWQNYFFQLGVICVLTLVSAIFRIHLPLALYILLIIILLSGVCIHGLFEIIRWEQYYASEGINLCAHNRTKRLLAIIVLSLFGLAFALLLTSDNNLVPFSLVTGFFAWLFSLLRRSSVQVEHRDSSENIMRRELMPEFIQFEDIPSSPVWELISKYGLVVIKYILIILAAAIFIRFMISPFLNRGEEFQKLSLRKKLLHIITEWYRGMIDAFSSFFFHLKKDKVMKLKKINADIINSTAQTILGAYSPVKKRDIRRSLTLFARLIIWGSEVWNVKWKPSHAPGEYCSILAAAIPADIQNEGIIRCGVLFEKALYSAEVLSDTERKEFKFLVKKITSGFE
jgi:hypothetical protein